MRFLHQIAIVLGIFALHFALIQLAYRVSQHYYWTPVAPGEQEQSLVLAGIAWRCQEALSFPFGSHWNSLFWAICLYTAYRLRHL